VPPSYTAVQRPTATEEESLAHMRAFLEARMARSEARVPVLAPADEQSGQGQGAAAAVGAPALLCDKVQVQSQSQRPATILLDPTVRGKSPGQLLFSVDKGLLRNKGSLEPIDGKGPSTRENTDPPNAPWLQKSSSETWTPERWAAWEETRLFDRLLDQSGDICWQGADRFQTSCPHAHVVEWTWLPTGHTGQTNVPCRSRWCSVCQPNKAKDLAERAWRNHLRLYQTIRADKVWRAYRDKLNYKGHKFLRVPQDKGVSVVFTTRCDGTKVKPIDYFDAIWDALRTSPPGTRLSNSDEFRSPPREPDPNLSARLVDQVNGSGEHRPDRETFFAIVGGRP